MQRIEPLGPAKITPLSRPLILHISPLPESPIAHADATLRSSGHGAEGYQTGVLTNRLVHYIDVWKLHLIVHPCGLESRSLWLVSRTEWRAHGDACRVRGNLRQIANFSPVACASRPTSRPWMLSHRLKNLVAQGLRYRQGTAVYRTHHPFRTCFGWRWSG